MPDIDVDFCARRRDEVLRYVRNKYGEENVAQIATFGTLAATCRHKRCGESSWCASSIGGPVFQKYSSKHGIGARRETRRC